VETEPNTNVFESVETALTRMQQKIPPDLMVVRYEGQKKDTGELVKDELDNGHGSTSANCFVLELLQLEGGKKTDIHFSIDCTCSNKAIAVYRIYANRTVDPI